MKLLSLILLNAITMALKFTLAKYKTTSVRKEGLHRIFPLQVCGKICGASVVVFGCLAANYYKLFKRFSTFQGIRQSADLSSLKYLKNIYYGTFLRVLLMKWFIETKIYIFDIVGEKCKEFQLYSLQYIRFFISTKR